MIVGLGVFQNISWAGTGRRPSTDCCEHNVKERGARDEVEGSSLARIKFVGDVRFERGDGKAK